MKMDQYIRSISVDLLAAYVFASLFMLITLSNLSLTLINCCGKKKETDGEKNGDESPAKPQDADVGGTMDPNYQTLAGIGGDIFGAGQDAGGAAQGAGGAAPYPGGVVAGAGAGASPMSPGLMPPIEAPRPPAVGGMAGTMDPNYQTLAGISGDVFGDDKAMGAAGGGGGATPQAPRPPEVGGMAATMDPNYQTLAGISGDVFGADRKT